MKTTVGKLKQLLENVVLEDESTKDSLIGFIMEELHAEFVSKYDIVSVRPRGKASKQDDMITLRPVVSLIDKDLVYRVFGDIAQTAFHCVWDVTGDEPHIEIHKPHVSRVAYDGPHATIETNDIRIALMMNGFGYTSLYVFRQNKTVKEAIDADHGQDNLVGFIVEELHVQLSELYQDVALSKRLGAPSHAQDQVINFHSADPRPDKERTTRVLGVIGQLAFDCLREVTGDEPTISHLGASLKIVTSDVFVVVMMYESGDVSVLVDRHSKPYVMREAALESTGYQSLLDQAMQDMLSVNKTLEKAHEQAPAGAPKAIIMGLHSDVFNTIATFREYVGKLKGLKQ